MKYLIGLLFLIVSTYAVSAQIRLDNWKTYSSLNNVRAATLDESGHIWVATSGGVFRYDTTTKETIEFRNINALLSLDATAIAYNPINKSIYVGMFDGGIDIIDKNLNFKHITDIRYQTTLTRRRINDFLFVGNKVYVAGDFGLIDFNENNAPGDDVQKLGTFEKNTPILKINILRDSIWAATPLGIAYAPLSSPSLKDPKAWNTITSSNGLFPNSNVIGMVILNNDLYIAQSSGMVKYSSGVITPIPGLSNLSDLGAITSISASNKLVYYVDSYALFSVAENGNVVRLLQSPDVITGHTTSGNLVFPFYKLNGMGIIRGSGISKIILNTPISNLFLNITVDTKGSLWSTTNYDNSQGFTLYSNGNWTSFTTTTKPQLKGNGYFRISSLPDGSTWAGCWGCGVTRIENDSVITIFNETNSSLAGIKDVPTFILAGEAASDRNGTVWITNLRNDNPTPVLVAKNTKGDWFGFTNESVVSKHTFQSISVDFSSTKWLGSSDGDGLVYFYEKSTLSAKDDDIWGKVTSSNSALPDNAINAIVVDKNGALWIGTPSGIAVMFTPSTVQRNSLPFVQKINSLSNQVINDIAVDALNNKWVATNEGVFVLNDDGSSVLGIINATNSPLISNQVKSVAVDELSGKVYFGTEVGLSEVTTLSQRPLEEYAIVCFPQPFAPETDGELVIEGLAAESSIRILSVDGTLIRALDTKSRRTVWDGRTENGELAPTGVYIVKANSTLNNSGSLAKIAVIRK
ncbi:MAG: hypothetical protein JST20_02405 [Bacteroidetes bacterium]|nr:hypothetical protein [Bacteroidota bacterium]